VVQRWLCCLDAKVQRYCILAYCVVMSLIGAARWTRRKPWWHQTFAGGTFSLALHDLDMATSSTPPQLVLLSSWPRSSPHLSFQTPAGGGPTPGHSKQQPSATRVSEVATTDRKHSIIPSSTSIPSSTQLSTFRTRGRVGIATTDN
jgi:hypothetical protein